MEGIAHLGFNQTFLAQLVNFFILLILLYIFAYRPILKKFDERSQKIKESMDLTESIKSQAANAETEARKRIDAASREGQEAVAKAIRSAEEIKQQAKDSAKPEADALINKARMEIQRERDEAIGQLRKEVADLTITAAEKVIGQKLDKAAHLQLIESVLNEAEGLK